MNCDDDSCAICLDIISGTKDCCVTACNHKFHTNCLSQIKNGCCPLCRASIVIEDTSLRQRRDEVRQQLEMIQRQIQHF